MLPRRNHLIVSIYITVVLALPVYPSFLPSDTFEKTVSSQQETALNVPYQLGEWCGVDDQLDDEQKRRLTSGSVIYRTYTRCGTKNANDWIELEVLQGTAELHCLLFCLANPVILKTIVIPSKSGNIKASLVRFRWEFKDHLALLWYQTPEGSGPADNRWAVRLKIRLGKLLPGIASSGVNREVLILLPENKGEPSNEGDLRKLSEFAKLVYELPFAQPDTR